MESTCCAKARAVHAWSPQVDRETNEVRAYDLRRTFARRLKWHRAYAGLSQRSLAEDSGVQQWLISKLENKKRASISFVTITKLCETLGIEPKDLL